MTRDRLISLLSSCPSLRLSQAIHAAAAKLGLGSDPFLQAALVSLYSTCGSLPHSRQMLDEMTERNPVPWNVAISSFFRSGDCDAACELFSLMPSPNAVTWSAVIAGLVQNGRGLDSLRMFRRMRREFSCEPIASNAITSALSACSKLRGIAFGQQVHAFVSKIGNFAYTDSFVGAALVDMYGKCGCMELAQKAFNFMVTNSVVAWSSLIATYALNSKFLAAVDAFREMVISGVVPNSVTLTTLISACSHIPYLLYGKELHAVILRQWQQKPGIYVLTALVGMYCKCGSTNYAHHILEIEGNLLGTTPTSIWNAVISDHVANGRFYDALSVIRSMKAPLNAVTMAIALPISSVSVPLLHGKELHCYAQKYELDKDTIVGNALLGVYCKRGNTTWAQKLFDRMPERSVVSWTTLINGYGMQGDGFRAIQLFERMVGERDVEPDHITFVALVSACSHSGLVEEGLGYFQAMTREYGIVPTEENLGSLVDLLARAGRIDEANDVIRRMPMEPAANVWGALLGACRIHGRVDGAELAGKHLINELKPKGSGFHTLLSRVYAETGRWDSAADVQMKKAEIGMPLRKGVSWLEMEGTSL